MTTLALNGKAGCNKEHDQGVQGKTCIFPHKKMEWLCIIYGE